MTSTTVLHLLRRAVRNVDSQVSERADGLTASQREVLTALDAADYLNQTQLVKRTGIDRSTLSDVVRRLKSRELLRRERNLHDTRCWQVRITEEGREALAAARKAQDDVERDLLATVVKSNRDAFVRALTKLAHSQQEAQA